MHTDDNRVNNTKVDTVLFLRNSLFNIACLRMSLGPYIENEGAI